MSPVKRGTDVEIPLPPPYLRLMGDTDERFTEHGISLAAYVYRWGLKNDHEILDVGCSVGRLAIGLLAGTDFKGRYVGFDVMADQVRWAKRTLQPVAPRFFFRYVDVRNDRYNPEGTVAPADMTFPARDDGFHMATLFSIFTHFYRPDIEKYLAELYRCIRPGGHVLASWFLFDEDTLEAAQSGAYPMAHSLDDDTIYNDPEDPLRAIAFRESAVREMIAASGLELVEIEYGTWKGGSGPEFQDHLLLHKPA